MSKLDKLLDEIYEQAGDWKPSVVKIDLKIMMLEIFKEALKTNDVAEMGDKYRKLVEEL